MNAIYDYLITKANIREKMQQQGKVSNEELNGKENVTFNSYRRLRCYPGFFYVFRFNMNTTLMKKSTLTPELGSIKGVQWKWMLRG